MSDELKVGDTINIGDVYVRNPNIVAWSSGVPAAYINVTSEPYQPDPKYGNWLVVDAELHYDFAPWQGGGPWSGAGRVNVDQLGILSEATPHSPTYVKKTDEKK